MNEGGNDAYHALAARLVTGGILSDPWLDDGRPRFSAEPVVLDAQVAAQMTQAAEAVTAVHNEVARLCAADPALCRDFLTLGPTQALMWAASAPLWHGMARADVFVTDEGLAVCELNSDTPSGQAETVLLNEAAAEREGFTDPNRMLLARLCALVEELSAELVRPPGPLTVGIVYPTDQVEDLSMIALYRRHFSRCGWRVVIGSPYNLARHRDGAALFDTRCDVFIRHYKTDWWSEREPVWKDAPAFPDADPLDGPLRCFSRRRLRAAAPSSTPSARSSRRTSAAWRSCGRHATASPRGHRTRSPASSRTPSGSSACRPTRSPIAARGY